MKEVISALKTTKDETLIWLRGELSQLATGRANPAILDSVKVEVYGVFQPVKNLANINLEDARTLRVAPWDKSTIKAIESSIRDTKLPVSVSADSGGVRVSIPQLTEEDRKKVVKLAKDYAEQAKVRIKKSREKLMKEIDDAEDVSGDEKFAAKKSLQDTVDAVNRDIVSIFEEKEKEILSTS